MGVSGFNAAIRQGDIHRLIIVAAGAINLNQAPFKWQIAIAVRQQSIRHPLFAKFIQQCLIFVDDGPDIELVIEQPIDRQVTIFMEVCNLFLS